MDSKLKQDLIAKARAACVALDFTPEKEDGIKRPVASSPLVTAHVVYRGRGFGNLPEYRVALTVEDVYIGKVGKPRFGKRSTGDELPYAIEDDFRTEVAAAEWAIATVDALTRDPVARAEYLAHDLNALYNDVATAEDAVTKAIVERASATNTLHDALGLCTIESHCGDCSEHYGLCFAAALETFVRWMRVCVRCESALARGAILCPHCADDMEIS